MVLVCPWPSCVRIPHWTVRTWVQTKTKALREKSTIPGRGPDTKEAQQTALDLGTTLLINISNHDPSYNIHLRISQHELWMISSVKKLLQTCPISIWPSQEIVCTIEGLVVSCLRLLNHWAAMANHVCLWDTSLLAWYVPHYVLKDSEYVHTYGLCQRCFLKSPSFRFWGWDLKWQLHVDVCVRLDVSLASRPIPMLQIQRANNGHGEEISRDYAGEQINGS